MIIYEALEIKKDATGTGLWRMVKSSDEAKERTYFPLCDCANGHSTPDEARDCAAEQHPQDAFLNPPKTIDDIFSDVAVALSQCEKAISLYLSGHSFPQADLRAARDKARHALAELGMEKEQK